MKSEGRVRVSVTRNAVKCYNVCFPSLPHVCSDLLQNPLIVPVKVLRGHQVVNKIGGHTHTHTRTHARTHRHTQTGAEEAF